MEACRLKEVSMWLKHWALHSRSAAKSESGCGENAMMQFDPLGKTKHTTGCMGNNFEIHTKKNGNNPEIWNIKGNLSVCSLIHPYCSV